MRITVHGHRPALLRPPAPSAPPAPSPSSGMRPEPSSVAPNAETVRNVNLGFFKLKIHRQTAMQASLMTEVTQQQTTGLTGHPPEAQHPGPDAPDGTAAAVPEAAPLEAPAPALPRAHAAPFTRDDYIAHWTAWAEGGNPADRENRPEAVRQMTHWLDAAAQHTQPPRLNLSTLRLTSLPQHLPPNVQSLNLFGNRLRQVPDQLPATLHTLDISSNRLDHLPDTLPPGLTHLDAEQNRLRQLPAHLPALEHLNVAENHLQGLPEDLPASLLSLHVSDNIGISHLPDTLPQGLTQLYAHGCRLTHLPAHLPASLQRLDVAQNRLLQLPESLVTQRDHRCQIALDDNPLNDHTRERLHRLLNAPDYRGPRISFSIPEPVAALRPRSLAQNALAWLTQPHSNVGVQARLWHSFAREPGAAAFSTFLDRLRNTVNHSNPQFRRSVADWLTHLESHPTLRRDTFMLSEGASASCEDRISLTLNAMRNLRLSSDVAQGAYDQRLPELVTLARGMFRLDQLEAIARETTAALNFVDEVEVYLAYQVRLREPLGLPVDTPDMRYFNVSYVTQADLDQAQARVLAAEQQHFANFLATDWQPWQAVLQRLDPEGYAQAQDARIDAMGDEFNQRLRARLEAMGLENDADAQREVGPQVRAEIARDIDGQLTRHLLTRLGLIDLLNR